MYSHSSRLFLILMRKVHLSVCGICSASMVPEISTLRCEVPHSFAVEGLPLMELQEPQAVRMA
jgi:hypothetical protein